MPGGLFLGENLLDNDFEFSCDSFHVSTPLQTRRVQKIRSYAVRQYDIYITEYLFIHSLGRVVTTFRWKGCRKIAFSNSVNLIPLRVICARSSSGLSANHKAVLNELQKIFEIILHIKSATNGIETVEAISNTIKNVIILCYTPTPICCYSLKGFRPVLWLDRIG